MIYNKQTNKSEQYGLKNENGQSLNDKEIADAFNEYFIKLPIIVLENEYGNLNNYTRKLTSNYSNGRSMYMMPTDEVEMYNAILKLNNGNSTGTDGIKSKIFKKCAVQFSNILSYYVNIEFENGNYPDELKTAKIVPIYKKSGEKSELKNYRPISILNTMSKIYETCLYNRLYNYLESIDFFKSNQFGFIKKSNTTSACITFVDGLQRALNENQIVCSIFLDVANIIVLTVIYYFRN